MTTFHLDTARYQSSKSWFQLIIYKISA